MWLAVELLADLGDALSECDVGLYDLLFFAAVHAGKVHDHVSVFNGVAKVLVISELLAIAGNDIYVIAESLKQGTQMPSDQAVASGDEDVTLSCGGHVVFFAGHWQQQTAFYLKSGNCHSRQQRSNAAGDFSTAPAKKWAIPTLQGRVEFQEGKAADPSSPAE